MLASSWRVNHAGSYSLQHSVLVATSALRVVVLLPMSTKLVIIESPYAGDVEQNLVYARACLRDSLERGEAPIASHLLYTQPNVLDDNVPIERLWGIDAGRRVADLHAFYVDRGWSIGMRAAQVFCIDNNKPYEIRSLP